MKASRFASVASRLRFMRLRARLEGLEPPTHGFEGRMRPAHGSSKALQPLATTRDDGASESTQSQAFAPFAEDSADWLRTLLTVKEAAAYLHVSTKMVYRLCALGDLRHIRVLNAIRIAPSDIDAFMVAHRT